MNRLKLEFRSLGRRSRGSFGVAVALRFVLPLLCAAVTLGAISCHSQMIIRRGLGGFEIASDSNQSKPDIESSGMLKTDPDLESILQQAERYKDDGNYLVATQLWQEVLKRSGDSLYSGDGTTYFSLVQQVEAILANLPPDGLSAYRVLADAQAKEILAQTRGPDDAEALSKIVRSYFVSSFGDEAAFQLGCIYLDQYDFIGARRLFEKVVSQHPDPSIPMDELHSRIALCHAFLGEVELAEVSLERAAEVNDNSEHSELIRRSLVRLGESKTDRAYLASWLNPMGDARRYGVMPPLPKETMSQDLAAVWQFYFDPKDIYKTGADVDGQMLSGENASGADVLATLDEKEEKLVESWRKKGWRPAGHLLLEGDRVYFKTGSDISVWNRNKVSKLAKEVDAVETDTSSAVEWRSMWHNEFRLDEATQMLEMVRQNFNGSRRSVNRAGNSRSPIPTGLTEVNFFGDRIYQQMSIHNGQFYAIEGKSFPVTQKYVRSTARPQWNSSIRRTRTNYLTAYDAVSGNVQWTLPRESDDDDAEPAEAVVDEEESPWIGGGGFMSAPVGFGEMLLVPVNNGGAISIYALDPKQEGKTIWKSFLCDEPETGAVPWSAINLSVEGSDLFVSCGMGVVFVLDPATGAVRFAKRYQRDSRKLDPAQRRNNWMPNRLEFDGWSSDTIVPYRQQMICFNSDSDWIVAYDRNSGEMIWKSAVVPQYEVEGPIKRHMVDYILGVYDNVLYAAGTEKIIAYDLESDGSILWVCCALGNRFGPDESLAGEEARQAKLKAKYLQDSDDVIDGKKSLGRGLLTPDGVYVPVEDTIYHLDLKGLDGNAKVLAKVHVDLGTNAPIGNLYSDGERFWVHGANRLYALGPAE